MLIFCILPSKANELVAVNQTHFTMDAIPSRRGRVHQTRDMAEMFVCICGSRVKERERVLGSKTALRCGHDGCETSWVSITFLRISTDDVLTVSLGLLQLRLCPKKLALRE